jgi:hypothetical protein
MDKVLRRRPDGGCWKSVGALEMPSETPQTISPEAENGLAVNVLLRGMVGGSASAVFPAFCDLTNDGFFAYCGVSEWLSAAALRCESS